MAAIPLSHASPPPSVPQFARGAHVGAGYRGHMTDHPLALALLPWLSACADDDGNTSTPGNP